MTMAIDDYSQNPTFLLGREQSMKERADITRVSHHLEEDGSEEDVTFRLPLGLSLFRPRLGIL
jgi:hypothetical protein